MVHCQSFFFIPLPWMAGPEPVEAWCRMQRQLNVFLAIISKAQVRWTTLCQA
jgi:hypothetical protein